MYVPVCSATFYTGSSLQDAIPSVDLSGKWLYLHAGARASKAGKLIETGISRLTPVTGKVVQMYLIAPIVIT